MNLLRVPAGAARAVRFPAMPAWQAAVALFAAAAVLAGCSQAPVPRAAGSGTVTASSPAPLTSAAVPRATSPSARRSSPARPPVSPATSAGRTPSPLRSTPAAPAASHLPAVAAPARLPVAGDTADAGQVITVAAPALGSERATVQAWQRSGAGWLRVGPSTPAWLGAAGLSTSAREGYTGTPVGSFTLTQSFGNNSNPGTRLPYFEAGPDDWWSGDSSSPTYNTHQRCASGSCPFDTGQSENLHDAGWVYGYAVVIDYNTAPARPGRGSAFFLHVSQNEPTAGCVSIDRDDLVRMLRWLDPARHPRILMGVG